MNSASSSQFNSDDLIDRLMGNEPLAKRIAEAFLESMPQQLTALARAIDSFDAKATTMAAHSIKGIAANVGTETVRDLASEMQKLGECGALVAASMILPELEATFESVKPVVQDFCRPTSDRDS